VFEYCEREQILGISEGSWPRNEVVADVEGQTCRRPYAAQSLSLATIGQMSKRNNFTFRYSCSAEFEFLTMLSGSF
jgi:hypothetical protein